MKVTKKCVESRQLHIEGYSQESRVELDGNVKVQSISLTSENEQDDVSVYEGLLEKILDRDNMNLAFKRVKKNKGSHGVDGLTIEELLPYLKEHGNSLRQSLKLGKYKPKPVRRVEIPKGNGRTRKLGIPTVVDRVIQQSITQILTPIFEKVFSETSYGFRPNRGCHDALKKCKEYINEGYRWAIDIDLKSYFDTVNQDILIGLIYKEVKDIRVISLIRKYMQSGIMENGLIVKSDTGVPQGGNLSPLLSNVMLNELDKELERRGLRFVRYADDCNIYVKSRKSAERVMKSITKYIEETLKLTVNKEKSSVGRPWKLKFLGYSFYHKRKELGFRVHEKSVRKLKDKLKQLTKRNRIGNIELAYKKLKQITVGWINYFKLADMKIILKKLDEWLRRRIRQCYWKQWKKIKTKFNNLKKLGLVEYKAWEYANTRKGYWRISNSPILACLLTNNHLKKLGFTSLLETYTKIH